MKRKGRYSWIPISRTPWIFKPSDNSNQRSLTFPSPEHYSFIPDFSNYRFFRPRFPWRFEKSGIHCIKQWQYQRCSCMHLFPRFHNLHFVHKGQALGWRTGTIKLNPTNVDYYTCVLTLRNEKHQQNPRNRYRKHGSSSGNFKRNKTTYVSASPVKVKLEFDIIFRVACLSVTM